jgi:hypothetical protein
MSPLVQIARSSFHCFYTSALDLQYLNQTTNQLQLFLPDQQTKQTAKSPRTARILNAPTFPPPEPTSQSQWSSRSTEYTRRSRTCLPVATGSCRNSAGRAWASSRLESLRTLYCKWWGCWWRCFGKKGNGVGNFVLHCLGTIADRLQQGEPERTPHCCRLLCAPETSWNPTRRSSATLSRPSASTTSRPARMRSLATSSSRTSPSRSTPSASSCSRSWRAPSSSRPSRTRPTT